MNLLWTKKETVSPQLESLNVVQYDQEQREYKELWGFTVRDLV